MAVGHVNGVATLIGFSNEKMYGHFAGTIKLRWPYITR